MTELSPVPFQRIGSISNSHVGREFEAVIAGMFEAQGYRVRPDFRVQVGFGGRMKNRAFDLGSDDPKLLVECKSHRWTTGGNNPSAKMTVWTEALYFFHLAPLDYRKCLCVLRDVHPVRGVSLADHYVRNHFHLIPPGVEIIEFDTETSSSRTIFGAEVLS